MSKVDVARPAERGQAEPDPRLTSRPELPRLARIDSYCRITASDVVAWATSSPRASSAEASAKATCRRRGAPGPRVSSAPLSARSGLRKLTLISIEEIADAGREQRMNRAAGGRVEQRAQQATVDDSDRVVGRLVWRAPEHGLAVADRAQRGADESRERRAAEGGRR